jgi:hypothetical protein
MCAVALSMTSCPLPARRAPRGDPARRAAAAMDPLHERAGLRAHGRRASARPDSGRFNTTGRPPPGGGSCAPEDEQCAHDEGHQEDAPRDRPMHTCARRRGRHGRETDPAQLTRASRGGNRRTRPIMATRIGRLTRKIRSHPRRRGTAAAPGHDHELAAGTSRRSPSPRTVRPRTSGRRSPSRRPTRVPIAPKMARPCCARLPTAGSAGR